MKRLLLIVSLTFFLIETTEAQRFDWLRVYASSGFSSTDLATAVSGNNVFVAGEFRGSVSFGSTVLNAPASNIQQVYVANYDTLGNFRWATNGGSPTGFADLVDMEVDQAGNVYLIGTYNVSFQWGSVSMMASSGGGSFVREGFILKLNSSGVSQWVRGVYSSGASLFGNAFNQLSVVGNSIYFGGTISRDISLTNSGLGLTQTTFQNDGYVGRLDLAGNFNFLERIFDTNQSFSTSFLLSDIEGVNDSVYYTSGVLRGTYTIGSNGLSYTSSTSNIFLSRFTNRNCDWFTNSTSSSSFFSADPQIATQNGSVYLAGTFGGSLSFQGRSIATGLGSPFSNIWFASKFDSSGSLEEIEPISVSAGSLTDIALNNKSELYLVGSYNDSVSFAGNTVLSNGNTDILMLNLDSNLTFNWFQVAGGGNADQAISIASHNSSNVYVLSNFRGLSQFGSSFFTGSNSFNTSIIKKISECGNTPVSLSFNGDTNLCAGQFVRIQANVPNPGTFQWLKDSVPLTGEIFRDLIIDSTGNYQVIINAQGCVDTSRAVPVNVGTPPTVTYNQTDTVCEQAAPIALSGGLPTGGFYRGPGVVNNTFDPSLTGIGNITVWYVFSNGGCLDSASSNIFVKPAPTAFFAPIPNVCVSASPITLTNAFPPGGTFSGNGVSGNQFDPAIAGGGLTTITYSYTGPGGCTVSVDQTVEVDTLPQAIFSSILDLCANESPILLSQGNPAGGTYSGTGVTGNEFDPSVSGNGTFTLSYTLSNQCGTSTANQTITVNPAPTINLNNFSDVCEGSTSFALSGGTPAGGSYSGIGVSAGNFDPSIAGVGTFTLFYDFTDALGCSSRDSATITVNPLPTGSISNDTSICAGSSVNLTASGGSNYLWSNAATTASTNVSPTATTQYTVTVSNANGCTSVENVTVTVNPLPMASIGGNTTICEGSSTTLTGSGGQSYAWSSGQNTASITVSPTVSTTYSLTVTDANGCSNTASQLVNVNPAPTVNLNNFADVCEGSAAFALSGGTPAGGSYSGIGVSAGSFDPSIAGVGTFTLFYDFTDALGCSSRDSATITVNPLPTSSISNDTAICTGSSVNLTASGGSSYLWSNAVTTASINVSPTASTQYTVTISNASGCTSVENVTVTVNPLPTASIGGNTTICEGSSTTLTGSGGQSYAWSSGQNTASITVSPSVNTTYSLTVTDANGCSNTASQLVNVNPAPTVNLNNFTDVCEGSAAFALSGGTPAGGSYSGIGVSAGNFDPAVSGVGTFTLFYDFTDALGCSSRDSASITVNALPNSSINNDTAICTGSSVNLTANGGSSFLWSNAATTASINVSPTATTQYTVTVSNASGCNSVENVTVTVNPLPTLSVSNDTTICLGDSVSLSATSNSNIFTWSNGQNSAQIKVAPTTNTTYLVSVSNAQTCTAIDSILVTINTGTAINIGPDTTLDPVIQTTYIYDAGSGFASYLWQDNSTNQTFTVNYDPAKAGLTDTITVVVSNPTISVCPSFDTALVFYDFPSSLKKRGQAANNIRLMPNPTSDRLQILFAKPSREEKRVLLYDMKGALVFEQTFNPQSQILNLSAIEQGINKGVYLINVLIDDEVYQEKVVIQ